MNQLAPFRVLAASGQLGYGVDKPAFLRGLERRPHMIGADMGSVDPGPGYLGIGRMATAPETTRRDLSILVEGARSIGVPLIIGSAGTAGARPHLDAVAAIIRDIAAEKGLSFRFATIAADIDRERVRAARDAGKLDPLGAIDRPDDATLDASPHIVAQMGERPIMKALAEGAEVVLAGRACDTAIYTSLALAAGHDRGLSTHMAKIVECASLCCLPGGRESMLGTLDGDHFTLDSMNPNRHATPTSVAAHALYEQSDPFVVVEPDGVLDLAAARYEALDEHRVKVSGARWTDERPSLKIEGAAPAGYRSVFFAGTSDPRVIERIETIWQEVVQVVSNLTETDASELLSARFFGLDGVIAGAGRGSSVPPPREIGILVECIAPTQAQAHSVLATTKQYFLHHGFPGRLSTAGNLAFPFTPPELDAGPAWRFSLHHRMWLDDEAELETLFPITHEQL